MRRLSGFQNEGLEGSGVWDSSLVHGCYKNNIVMLDVLQVCIYMGFLHILSAL